MTATDELIRARVSAEWLARMAPMWLRIGTGPWLVSDHGDKTGVTYPDGDWAVEAFGNLGLDVSAADIAVCVASALNNTGDLLADLAQARSLLAAVLPRLEECTREHEGRVAGYEAALDLRARIRLFLGEVPA